MPSLALSNDQVKVTFNNSTATDTSMGAICERFYLKASDTVHVAFDRAATTDDMSLAATDGIVEIECPATMVSAIGGAATGTLQIMGVR